MVLQETFIFLKFLRQSFYNTPRKVLQLVAGRLCKHSMQKDFCPCSTLQLLQVNKWDTYTLLLGCAPGL